MNLSSGYPVVVTMKSVIQVVVAALALTAAPVAVFSQGNPLVTRAQVGADLIQVKNASANPNKVGVPYYPTAIQAAGAKAAA